VFPTASTVGRAVQRLTVVNTGAQDLQGTLSLYENSGQLIAVANVALPALSAISGTIDELAPSAARFDGYAVVDAADGSERLIGFETQTDGVDFVLIPTFQESARLRTGNLSYFVTHGAYASRLTLVNHGSETQVLRISATLEG